MIEGKRLNTALCMRIWNNTCWALEDGSQEGRELDLLSPRGGKPQNPSQSSSFLIRAANRKTCYVRMVSTLSWSRSRRPTSTSEFQPGFRRVPCVWRHSTLPYWRPSSAQKLEHSFIMASTSMQNWEMGKGLPEGLEGSAGPFRLASSGEDTP